MHLNILKQPHVLAGLMAGLAALVLSLLAGVPAVEILVWAVGTAIVVGGYAYIAPRMGSSRDRAAARAGPALSRVATLTFAVFGLIISLLLFAGGFTDQNIAVAIVLGILIVISIVATLLVRKRNKDA